MKSLTFGVGVLSACVIFGGLLVTATSSRYRFWPPGDNARNFRAYQASSLTFLLCFVATGYLDWNAGPLPWPRSALVGGVLFAAGLAVARRGGLDLGREETEGKAGELQIDGAYRYTRNPQTVGYWLVFASSGFVTNSVLVAALSMLPIGWLYLMARVEEPWLREQYGEAYTEYSQEVPRFLGYRTLVRVFGRD